MKKFVHDFFQKYLVKALKSIMVVIEFYQIETKDQF